MPGDMTVQQQLESGLSHHQAGRLTEAERIYRNILVEEPDQGDALYLLSVLAGQAGRLDEAMDLARRVIRLRPKFAEAHNSLGNALARSGQSDEAIAAYRQAIALNPHLAEAHNNLANALMEKGQLDEAILYYRGAIRLRPDLAKPHNNLGNALVSTGQVEEAIVALQHAIRLNPDYVEAHSNLGNALTELGQATEAIASYRESIRLKPDYAEAHNNLGIALKRKGQLEEAIAAHRQALQLKPRYAEAFNNLGNALKEIGRLDEAVADYREAIRLRPDYTDAHSNLVYALQCHPGYDARMIHEELRTWNQLYAEPLRKFIQPHTNNRDPNRRLRIGYVSPDFRKHVVGQNLLPLFREHDHAQFDIFCYSSVVHGDVLTEQFQHRSDVWRSIIGLSDSRAADLIRQDRIDILVDLALHTAGNRLLIFARKSAPVQVTYLGYCSSTGLETMDYRLSDPYLDPPDSDLSLYSERTIRLPETYWCYSPGGPTPEPSPPPVEAAGHITFGCLNNFAKVSPALDLWAEVLKIVPESRLIVHSPPGIHLDAVRERFAGKDISLDRLEFPHQQPWSQYVRTYGRIDIALDPFPWGGGITTCDALWMGVPVVSLVGGTAVGRGGTSILANIGLPELIAQTPEQYVKIAVALAGDLPRLAELRGSLRQRMRASPLMDAPRFAREIEAAYRQMWRNWCEKNGESGLQSTAR
jgi:protein O-GlcNAc transferase